MKIVEKKLFSGLIWLDIVIGAVLDVAYEKYSLCVYNVIYDTLSHLLWILCKSFVKFLICWKASIGTFLKLRVKVLLQIFLLRSCNELFLKLLVFIFVVPNPIRHFMKTTEFACCRLFSFVGQLYYCGLINQHPKPKST